MKGAKLIFTNKEVKWSAIDVPLISAQEADLYLTASEGRELEGFGGCFNELGMAALENLDEDCRSDILDKLFSPTGECKFTLARMPIGASDYALSWYSLNETENDYGMAHFSLARDQERLIPYIRLALQRQPQLTISASPGSPPVWLKTHKACNYGRLKGDAQTQQAYALYFSKFVEEYKKQGIKISQVHVQNEVAADQKFPSCVWDGEQLKTFIRDYLGPRFEHDKHACEIWLGTINAPEFLKEIGRDYDDYAHCVLRDPEAYRHIRGVGYQWQGKNAIQRTVQSYPELRFYQTENECGDGSNSWPYAHYVFSLLRHYLTNGANGYLYWNMVLNEGGESTWGWHQNSMITVSPETKTVTWNPEYYVMRHFSGLMRPGARQLPVTGRMSGNAVACKNADGSRVVNINNPFDEPVTVCVRDGQAAWRMTLSACSVNSLVIQP